MVWIDGIVWGWRCLHNWCIWIANDGNIQTFLARVDNFLRFLYAHRVIAICVVNSRHNITFLKRVTARRQLITCPRWDLLDEQSTAQNDTKIIFFARLVDKHFDLLLMRSVRDRTETVLMLMIGHCTTAGLLLWLIISRRHASLHHKRDGISTIAEHLNCCRVLDVLERNAIRCDDSVVRSTVERGKWRVIKYSGNYLKLFALTRVCLRLGLLSVHRLPLWRDLHWQSADCLVLQTLQYS